jgi:predicted permease
MTLIKATEAGITPSARTAEIGLFAVVLSVVSLLLLLGCINVANLFLARASDRSREMAVRVALGASRSNLIRQLMVESMLYATLSAAAGLCLAAWAIGVVNRIALPMNITVRPDLTLSTPVLGWTLVVTMLTTVVFGLWPALRATRPSLVPALKGESAAGGSRSRSRRAMVIAQAALSVLLLAGAGFFLMNLREATQVDKGFASEGLVLAGLDPSLQGYARSEIVAFQDRLLDRLRSTPQVAYAALVAEAPLGVGSSDADVDIPGYVPSAKESMAVFYAATTPSYFATMAIPIRGRDFEARDDSTSVPVVIVNQQFVDRFFPGTNGLSQTVRFAGRSRTVVGVVPTGKYRSLGEAPTAFLWLPQAQSWRAAMTLVVRSRGPADGVMALVQREIATLDPNMPISSLRTMDAHLAFALLPARIAAIALASFGGLGLLLAAIGIYGVMTHAVVQRTREIGIRLALGASPGQIERSLLRDGMTLVAIGLGIGLGVAALSARLLRHLLYDGGGSALPVYSIIVAVLGTVAFAATIIPARRAARIDPALAMRSE